MKKLIKSFILCCGTVLKRNNSSKTVFYHDVSKRHTSMGTPSDVFWKHMDYLRPGDQVCFDDGFRGIWDEREEFAKRKIRPLVFIAIELVGQPGYLTWPEILTLQNDYGFDFQSHTWSHQTLAGQYNKKAPIPEEGRTNAWFSHELRDSKRELELRLNKTITSICFPVGYFSDDVVARCKAVGYECVYASYPGNISNDYVQTRCLCQDLSPFEFRLVLKGGMSILKKRYLRMHKIENA